MIFDFLGATPSYDESNYIAPSANLIGAVSLGEEASVWFNATVRADVNWIRIGAASNIQDNAVVHVTNRTAPTDIGEMVTVGHSAVVHGCTIHSRVLVGIGAVLLDHVVVGSDSLIGANALVTTGTEIPPGSLVLGSPARVVRNLTGEEIAKVREYAEGYLRYSRVYRGVETPTSNPFYDSAGRPYDK